MTKFSDYYFGRLNLIPVFFWNDFFTETVDDEQVPQNQWRESSDLKSFNTFVEKYDAEWNLKNNLIFERFFLIWLICLVFSF